MAMGQREPQAALQEEKRAQEEKRVARKRLLAVPDLAQEPLECRGDGPEHQRRGLEPQSSYGNEGKALPHPQATQEC